MSHNYYLSYMKVVLSAPKLTPPTYETLMEICERKSYQFSRILGKEHFANALLNVSCHKEGAEYEIIAKLSDGVSAIAKSSDRDLRKAATIACNKLKEIIVGIKDKKKNVEVVAEINV